MHANQSCQSGPDLQEPNSTTPTISSDFTATIRLASDKRRFSEREGAGAARMTKFAGLAEVRGCFLIGLASGMGAELGLG